MSNSLKQLWGIKFEWDLLAGGDEIKWVLLAAGSALVSFLMILTVTLVICCMRCRRSRKSSSRTRTPPTRSSSVFSGQSSTNSYDLPASEPPTPTHAQRSGLGTRSSAPAPARASSEKGKRNSNTTQSSHSNKNKRQFARLNQLYPIQEARNSSQSQHQQANGLALELAAPSAPLPSPDIATFTSPPQLDRQESKFSSHTYQEIDEHMESHF